MRRLIIVSIALLAWSQRAPAQLRAGSRVRITASGLPRSQGTLVAVNGDTLVLQLEQRADTLRIPVTSVSRIEMSRGSRSRVGRGIAYGALVGFATGAILGAVVGGAVRSAECPECGDSGAGSALPLGFVAAIPGGLVGGLIGAARRSERWEEVSVVP